jgi:hypothetical protein
MRRYLLVVVLVLMTVGATGCIIVDAAQMESRRPTTVRSEECVIRQTLAVATPALEAESEPSTVVAEP